MLNMLSQLYPLQRLKNWRDPAEYIPMIITLLYLAWVSGVVGLRSDHFIFLAIPLSLYYLHPIGRKLAIGFAAFFVYWWIYDSMRLYPNHAFNTVHIQQPYDLEKWLFGIQTAAHGILIPCEYFKENGTLFLDLLAAFFYINWISVPVFFGIYLWLTDKATFVKFTWLFLFASLLGFVIYYIYPAAPPWYVEAHGFDFKLGVPGDAAGLLAADEFFGVTLFYDMYLINPNPFAAIPSLHSAFPVTILVYSLQKREQLGYWNLLFIIFGLGIWFSAVYLRHHYIIDVIAGIGCVLVAYWLFEKVILKTKVRGLLDKIIDKI